MFLIVNELRPPHACGGSWRIISLQVVSSIRQHPPTLCGGAKSLNRNSLSNIRHNIMRYNRDFV